MPARPPLPAALFGFAAMLALSACTAAPPPDPSRPVTTAPLPVPEQPDLGALAWRGGLVLDGPIGGLSGIIVSPQGQLTAIGDRGHVLTAQLAEDEDGMLLGLEELEWQPLCRLNGGNVFGFGVDAEALTRLADGDWVVAFEQQHRLRRFGPEGPAVCDDPRSIVLDPGMNQLPRNRSLESAAGLPDGRLIIIGEGHVHNEPDLFPAWMWTEEAGWADMTYRGEAGFAPTDAAALPDGGLLVLERRFSVIEGVAARLVHVPGFVIAPDATVSGFEIARILPPWPVDNFEGLAIRPRNPQLVDLYLLSDDNFNRLQRSLLLHAVWDRREPRPDAPLPDLSAPEDADAPAASEPETGAVPEDAPIPEQEETP